MNTNYINKFQRSIDFVPSGNNSEGASVSTIRSSSASQIEQGTKLTRDMLSDLGFVGEGKSLTGKPLYRIEWQKHMYLLQVELNDYPEDNPNSGIVSIFYPEYKDQHVFTHEKKKTKGEKWDRKQKSGKVDFIESEDEEYVYGIKYVTFPESYHPIAWHVTTLERLNAIYTALTGLPPLVNRRQEAQASVARKAQ